MYCAGFKNVRLRYASYSATDNTPSHVYAVGTDENGREIIIDAVYKHFNKEVPYQYKKDYKMQIAVLSGTPVVAPRLSTPQATNLEKLLLKVRPGGLYFNVISNEINRRSGKRSNINYSPAQLSQYLNRITKQADKQSGVIKSILNNEAAALRAGNFTGTVYLQRSGQAIRGIEEEIGKLSLKKVGKRLKKVTKGAGKVLKKISPKNLVKGVKAVSFIAPRKAFLLLVRLNARGLATRLARLSDGDLKNFWVDKFAGELGTLKRTIKEGAKKRPLFGAGKKVRNIAGIGAVIDDTAGIGATGVEVAAVTAAAAPIVIVAIRALKGKGVPEVPEAAGSQESGNFLDAENAAASESSGLNSWIEKAVDIAQATGIIPDKPDTPAEAQVNNIVPGDDFDGDPSGPNTKFKIAPVLLTAGLLGTYFLLRNRKK